MTQPTTEELNRVAVAALRFVEPGMVLGLGTGRAAEAFIRALGERVRAGLLVRGIPTSERSAKLARDNGIGLIELSHLDRNVDVAFDGADEVTPALGLTKGLGGALLRERVVAYEANRFVVLVTPEKLVDKLGTRAPIPIEIVPFAQFTVARHLRALGADPVLRTREDGTVYVTDNQNVIIDARWAPIDEPAKLDASVRALPGVIDTGLFLDMADVVLVSEPHAVREIVR